MLPVYCNSAICQLLGGAVSSLSSGLVLSASQPSGFSYARRRVQWAGSVDMWQPCAWHPDNTPRDSLLAQRKTRESQTGTTRKSGERKKLADDRKDQNKADLCSVTSFLFPFLYVIVLFCYVSFIAAHIRKTRIDDNVFAPVCCACLFLCLLLQYLMTHRMSFYEALSL